MRTNPAIYASTGDDGTAPRPPLEPRAPLPPFDPDTMETADPNVPPTLHHVYGCGEGRQPPTTLAAAQTPLPPDNPRWWRGDAWGVTVPGLPSVAGGATGAAQDRVLTYFLGRYGRDWEDRILEAHLQRGYRHFSLSPQDEFANGMSFDDYVAMSVRVRQAGFHVHHLMRSKYYTSAALMSTTKKKKRPSLLGGGHLDTRRPVGRDLDAIHHRQFSVDTTAVDLDEPNRLIDALLNVGAMQVETPAWEMNYWSPEICRAMIDHDAAIIGMACLIEIHFYPHYITWQPDGEPPGSFWEANFGKVDGCLYQMDPNWSGGMMAARTQDCQARLGPGSPWGLSGDSGRGHPIDLPAWELIATCQFNNASDGNGRLADEDVGNVKGYEALCVPGSIPVFGFGNGARMPDGTAI